MTNLNTDTDREGEKILITGATGFIGSHVAEYFCKKNMQIFCLVQRSSNLQFIKDLPLNLIYGESDWSKQDEKLNTMKALGLNSFHTMKETGHFSFLESPKEVSEIILS